MSTSTAVLAVTDKINEALNSSYFSVGLFVDLRKAFDTVDHDILLRKLCCYGIRGKGWDFIRSYLSSRVVFSSVYGVSSLHLPLSIGVPQGSVLGPLLFSLYVNDLPMATELLSTFMYADDTCFFYSSKSASM